MSWACIASFQSRYERRMIISPSRTRIGLVYMHVLMASLPQRYLIYGISSYERNVVALTHCYTKDEENVQQNELQVSLYLGHVYEGRVIAGKGQNMPSPSLFGLMDNDTAGGCGGSHNLCVYGYPLVVLIS